MIVGLPFVTALAIPRYTPLLLWPVDAGTSRFSKGPFKIDQSHFHRTGGRICSSFTDQGDRVEFLTMSSNSSSPPPAPKSSASRSTNFSSTFYRRTLPTQTCVALTSTEGRAYFESALQSKFLKSFFPLIEQL